MRARAGRTRLGAVMAVTVSVALAGCGSRLETVADGLDNPGPLAVAADGGLHAVAGPADAPDRLVAVAPDGSTRTVVDALPGGVAADLAAGPDGSFYVALLASGPGRIVRVGPDRQVSVVRTDEPLARELDVTVGPDGRLYAAYLFDGVVVEIQPDGSTRPVVGSYDRRRPPPQEGRDATNVYLPTILDVAAVAHGQLVFVSHTELFRVDEAGRLHLLARVERGRSHDLQVGADGTVYVADPEAVRIYAVRPDGRVETLVGEGLRSIGGIAVTDDGVVYVSDPEGDRIVRIEDRPG